MSTPRCSEPPNEQHEAVPTKIRVLIDVQPVKLRPPPHAVMVALILGVAGSKSAPSRGVSQFEASLRPKCAACMPTTAIYPPPCLLITRRPAARVARLAKFERFSSLAAPRHVPTHQYFRTEGHGWLP